MALLPGLDMAKYLGAFMQEYTGPFYGNWYTKIMDWHDGLPTLTTLVPGIFDAPDLKAYTGTRQLINPGNFTQSLVSSPFEGSVNYPIDNFKADYLGVYMTNVRQLAQKALYHPNEIATTIIAANANCYDGVPFFGSTHPIYKNVNFTSGSATPSSFQSNSFTAAGAAGTGAGTTGYSPAVPSLNVAVATAPTDVEAGQFVIDLFAQLISLQDLAGNVTNGDTRKVTILTGSISVWSALQKATSPFNQILSDRTDNPVYGLAQGGITFEPVYAPGLTAANVYMFKSDGLVKGLIGGEVSIDVWALGPDSEYAKENRQVAFGVDAVRGGIPARYQSAVMGVLS
jgi:hypothetical protein